MPTYSVEFPARILVNVQASSIDEALTKSSQSIKDRYPHAYTVFIDKTYVTEAWLEVINDPINPQEVEVT